MSTNRRLAIALVCANFSCGGVANNREASRPAVHATIQVGDALPAKLECYRYDDCVKMCRGKSRQSCERAGLMASAGRDGAPKDEGLARRYWQLGCNGGVVDACKMLGWSLESKDHPNRDPKGAFEAFVSGCKLGNRDQCRFAAGMIDPTSPDHDLASDERRAEELNMAGGWTGNVFQMRVRIFESKCPLTLRGEDVRGCPALYKWVTSFFTTLAEWPQAYRNEERYKMLHHRCDYMHVPDCAHVEEWEPRPPAPDPDEMINPEHSGD